ncbi:MAG: Rossmann-like and DUF2520 domain-containing protein [Dehalococcoidia bacterium]
MLDTESLRVGLLGAGRLAASLGAALTEAGYRIEGVASRRPESARRLSSSLAPSVAPLSSQELVERCDLVFVTVPDAAVTSVASSVDWRSAQAVVHCSGALGLTALAGAAARGAAVGCFHPLQSFPALEGDASRFRGIACGIEASGDLSLVLESVAARTGASVVRLEGVDRAAYHAAAVFASNYVVSLMAAARRAWTEAGLPADAARPSLAPLLKGAADNVSRHELREALTGPVARGDVETVRRHLVALGDSGLAALYRELGAQLLTLRLPHDSTTAIALEAALAPPELPAPA